MVYFQTNEIFDEIIHQRTNVHLHFDIGNNSQPRVDENTGGALLECHLRTDIRGKSDVSSAISVQLN